jgi:hypothetical protein
LNSTLDEFLVGRLFGARVILKADANMAASLKCGLGKARPEHVTPKDAHHPWQASAVKHGDIGLEAGPCRREPKQRGGAAEVQLDFGSARKAAHPVVRKRKSKHARLKDRYVDGHISLAAPSEYVIHI